MRAHVEVKCIAADNLRVFVDSLEDFFQPVLIVLPEKAVHLVNDQIPQMPYADRSIADVSNQSPRSSDQHINCTVPSLDATQAHAFG